MGHNGRESIMGKGPVRRRDVPHMRLVRESRVGRMAKYGAGESIVGTLSIRLKAAVLLGFIVVFKSAV